jgi:aldose 1-epimerase
MTDALSLAAGSAQVELSPEAGGAIAAFTYRNVDVLRPTSREARERGDVRAHACYPLVPYSNRIAHARVKFAGSESALEKNFGDHPHSIHGVGWQRPWRVVARDEATALIALDHTTKGEEAGAWPWPFRATQWFGLQTDDRGATLTAKLAIANTGSAAFPFGLGFHPFFPRTAATALDFEAVSVWENDDTQIPVRKVAVPAGWRRGILSAQNSRGIDNVFTEWSGVATLADPGRPFDTRLAADGAAGFVVVYAPHARDFVAVEPVTHMTDAFNRAERGESGTGSRILAAGAGFSCTMQISTCLRP